MSAAGESSSAAGRGDRTAHERLAVLHLVTDAVEESREGRRRGRLGRGRAAWARAKARARGQGREGARGRRGCSWLLLRLPIGRPRARLRGKWYTADHCNGRARAHPRGDERRRGLVGRRRAPARRGARGRRRHAAPLGLPGGVAREADHGRCCAPEDQYDARRVADALGFPHFTFDRRALFAQTVVEPFVDAYLAGETPSPCTDVQPRREARGALRPRRSPRRGAASRPGTTRASSATTGGVPRLATGGTRRRTRATSSTRAPGAWLERLVFPLGESTKAEVRAEALARRLPGAGKGESQELCFVGAGAHAYADFVTERARRARATGADRRRGGTHRRRARRRAPLHGRPAQGARRGARASPAFVDAHRSGARRPSTSAARTRCARAARR